MTIRTEVVYRHSNDKAYTTSVRIVIASFMTIRTEVVDDKACYDVRTSGKRSLLPPYVPS